MLVAKTTLDYEKNVLRSVALSKVGAGRHFVKGPFCAAYAITREFLWRATEGSLLGPHWLNDLLRAARQNQLGRLVLGAVHITLLDGLT